MRFEFATATRIVFGPGAIGEAGPLARPFGTRALAVIGRDASRIAPLLERLKEHGISTTRFHVPGEPAIATVEAGSALAREHRCELVIGFGGGSVLDAGKAIAAMLGNPGTLLDYLEVIGRGKTLGNPSVPYIAIPTTAGTGAEVTRNAVVSSPEHRVKVSLRSPLMLPRVALVDPELTWSLPRAITASTGLDALTQLIEGYVSCRANPFTDALCVEGIRRAARSLRIACDEGRNAAAREGMALASLFGGLALANAGLGAVHGFAAPIGGMFAAPHGAVCAALLPHVMEANLDALQQRAGENVFFPVILKRYEEVARLLTGRSDASAEEGLEWVRNLTAGLRIPKLGNYGIMTGHAAALVEKAAQASSMKGNPIALSPVELSRILQRAL